MDEYFIETAIDIGKSICRGKNRYRLVAMLLDGKRIVATACNSGLNHAEMNCINNFEVTQKHKQYTLLVIRLLADDSISSAKPCKNCIQLLRKKRAYLKIKKVIYSDWNGELIEERIDDICNDHISFGNRHRFVQS